MLVPRDLNYCALLFLCLCIFLSSHIALGSCLPSGMVASHLTACMRNDKMGEASVLQNQTTVSCCPPQSSGSPSHFLLSSLARSLSILMCVVWSPLTCTLALLHTFNSIHQNCIASVAAPVFAVMGTSWLCLHQLH